MKCITLTNNPEFLIKICDAVPPVEFVEGTPLDVLQKASEMLEKGFYLVTHPLSANNRLNRSPYRSLILSDEKTWNGDDSKLLEQAISHLALQGVFASLGTADSDYRFMDFEHLRTAAEEARILVNQFENS